MIGRKAREERADAAKDLWLLLDFTTQMVLEPVFQGHNGSPSKAELPATGATEGLWALRHERPAVHLGRLQEPCILLVSVHANVQV